MESPWQTVTKVRAMVNKSFMVDERSVRLVITIGLWMEHIGDRTVIFILSIVRVIYMRPNQTNIHLFYYRC